MIDIARKTVYEHAVSDEEIIAALINSGTIREAARTLEISEHAVYTRMDQHAFKAKYNAAKADICRGAVLNINRRLCEAVDAVAQIMNDEDVNPAVRLQAAQTLMNNAGKFAVRLQSDEYQIATEQALSERCRR